MMKLFRYRPLSEFLFKELLYNEFYLASPTELNDPLDLNGQLNFYAEDETKIKALVHFLLKQAFVSSRQIELMKKFMDLMSYEKLGTYLKTHFDNYDSRVVSKSDLFEILSRYFEKIASIDKEIRHFDVDDLFLTLDDLFTQFLNNSSVVCFSESNNDFLMWSHYAGGHTGICLEFEVCADPENSTMCHFPTISRIPFKGKYIEWKENVKRVKYSDTLSRLNFFDYISIFDNAGDVDLMTLSKSYWHQYTYGIENTFLEKRAPCSTEKEWRIVHVNFQETMPEDRILHFNPNALTGVCFGAKTSELTQNRVKNILDKPQKNISFYKCEVDGTRGVNIYKI